jgi:AcrR family transcriptional regulator
LKDALVTLISKKGFEAVTIQDILDRANVGRSTFYMHFENKQDLLHSCFEDFSRLFEQHNIGISNNGKDSEYFKRSEFTLGLFRIIELNRRLFKAILGKDGMAMFSGHIHSYIYAHVSETLKALMQNKDASSLQLEILANYLTSAFLGTLKWWVDRDMPCTAEELDKNFIRFALYDIQQVLN